MQICFIGRKRTYKQEEETRIDAARTEFIQNRTQKSNSKKRSHDESEEKSPENGNSTAATTAEEKDKTAASTEKKVKTEARTEGKDNTAADTEEKCETWAKNFEARKPEEACFNSGMKVDKSVREMIMMKVFETLLNDKNGRKITLEGRGEYNLGGKAWS